jgi:murein L,D-transpeptidase YcbB/YkuD
MEQRYRKLIKLLDKYQHMPKFPKVPYTGKVLKLGNSSNNIKQIKRRLQISGDYPIHAKINNHFDNNLKRAVIRFQKRYLIKVTGMVDSTTIYYLNKPVIDNIQSIITNLDKTKLYPKSFENEYIEVNIPDFNMRYYKNGRKIMKTGLIVGRIDRPTPIFNSAVRYMVLNPTWTIPDNLIKRDLIHVLRENPAYLEENNIHVFSGNKEIQITQEMLDPYENSKKRVPYRFVQFPSEKNALGRVKFMFPNKYAVYLHDTDNKSLFNRRYKVYSSGCMRVEKPFQLMHTLLQHTSGYSPSRLEHIFGTNKPTTVKLNRAIPVHILYFTTYEEDGMAYFRHDIYLYDKIIQESAQGFKKPTFSIPSKRMITIKKQGEKPLSN